MRAMMVRLEKYIREKPGYLLRKEPQRDRLRTRAGRRAWRFEGRFVDRKDSELERKC